METTQSNPSATSRCSSLLLSFLADARSSDDVIAFEGVWVTSNTTVSDSFVRTNDDAIRLYAGAVDNYMKVPPVPRNGEPAVGIKVERMVV